MSSVIHALSLLTIVFRAVIVDLEALSSSSSTQGRRTTGRPDLRNYAQNSVAAGMSEESNVPLTGPETLLDEIDLVVCHAQLGDSLVSVADEL